jgi:hypothetical protein
MTALATTTPRRLVSNPKQSDRVVLGTSDPIVLPLFEMDRTLTHTVADLASNEAVRLRCDCRARTYQRSELAALVICDARLHLLGVNRELWCRDCGEPPFDGWIVAAVFGR